MEKIGVSQKAILFDKGGRFLVIRRTGTAPSDPNRWDLPGGELDFGEDAMAGIIREIREETGLEIRDLKPFDVESHINEDGGFWVTIAYTAKAISDKVVLSFEHNEFKWITAEEFFNLETSDKLKRFVNGMV